MKDSQSVAEFGKHKHLIEDVVFCLSKTAHLSAPRNARKSSSVVLLTDFADTHLNTRTRRKEIPIQREISSGSLASYPSKTVKSHREGTMTSTAKLDHATRIVPRVGSQGGSRGGVAYPCLLVRLIRV